MKAGMLAALAAWALAVPTIGAASDAHEFLQIANSTYYPAKYAVPDDIDGDGTSDLLWFNADTSQFAYWISDPGNTSSSYKRLSYKIFNVAEGYYISALGDLNNDGKTDLVWTSARNDLYLWTSTGNGFQPAYIGTYPQGWRLLGAGDVDGDGDADLLWSNPTTCQFGYWLMHGKRRWAIRSMPVACGYHVAAIGYFMLSNHVDLLWTSDAHDVYLWEGTGTGFMSTLLGTYGADERIIGAAIPGDFGGINVYVKNDSANEFSQYELRYWLKGDVVDHTTFDVINTFPLEAGDYLAGAGTFNNANEAALLWANDTADQATSPGSPGVLRWYTETYSDNSGWNQHVISNYPSGWSLVGQRH